jgi:flagellar motility protein MotE (MotC chaperone)
VADALACLRSLAPDSSEAFRVFWRDDEELSVRTALLTDSSEAMAVQLVKDICRWKGVAIAAKHVGDMNSERAVAILRNLPGKVSAEILTAMSPDAARVRFAGVAAVSPDAAGAIVELVAAAPEGDARNGPTAARSLVEAVEPAARRRLLEDLPGTVGSARLFLELESPGEVAGVLGSLAPVPASRHIVQILAISPKRAGELLRRMALDQALKVVAEMPARQFAILLPHLEAPHAITLLEQMPEDNAVSALVEIAASQAAMLLERISAARAAVLLLRMAPLLAASRVALMYPADALDVLYGSVAAGRSWAPAIAILVEVRPRLLADALLLAMERRLPEAERGVFRAHLRRAAGFTGWPRVDALLTALSTAGLSVTRLKARCSGDAGLLGAARREAAAARLLLGTMRATAGLRDDSEPELAALRTRRKGNSVLIGVVVAVASAAAMFSASSPLAPRPSGGGNGNTQSPRAAPNNPAGGAVTPAPAVPGSPDKRHSTSPPATRPRAREVQGVLDIYFGAINARRYHNAFILLTPRMQGILKGEQTFTRGESTSTISRVVVSGIEDSGDTLVVTLRFRSRQDGKQGRRPGETCTDWSFRYTMVDEAGELRIDRMYDVSDRPCPR